MPIKKGSRTITYQLVTGALTMVGAFSILLVDVDWGALGVTQTSATLILLGLKIADSAAGIVLRAITSTPIWSDS